MLFVRLGECFEYLDVSSTVGSTTRMGLENGRVRAPRQDSMCCAVFHPRGGADHLDSRRAESAGLRKWPHHRSANEARNERHMQLIDKVGWILGGFSSSMTRLRRSSN